MGRKLYLSQKKALMEWVDSVAARTGWGDWCRPPYDFPAEDDIPAEVYDRVADLNRWESFHWSALGFAGDYANWRYGYGHHGPTIPTDAEVDTWMRAQHH